jgi:hypothetical protein
MPLTENLISPEVALNSPADTGKELLPSAERVADNTPEQCSTRLSHRNKHKKAIRIGDALRSEGLDEREVARQLAGIVQRQTEAESDKQLAGTLLNCLRYLNDAAPGKTATRTPVSVKLVHSVPRPERAPQTRIKKQKGKNK